MDRSLSRVHTNTDALDERIVARNSRRFYVTSYALYRILVIESGYKQEIKYLLCYITEEADGDSPDDTVRAHRACAVLLGIRREPKVRAACAAGEDRVDIGGDISAKRE